MSTYLVTQEAQTPLWQVVSPLSRVLKCQLYYTIPYARVTVHKLRCILHYICKSWLSQAGWNAYFLSRSVSKEHLRLLSAKSSKPREKHSYFVWLRITDEGLVPEMRIWSILLIKSHLKWCIHLGRSLCLYTSLLWLLSIKFIVSPSYVMVHMSGMISRGHLLLCTDAMDR